MKNRLPHAEFIAYAIILVTGVSMLSSLDAFEGVYEFSRTHEHLELDEILLSLPVAMLCLAIYAFRRTWKLRRNYADLEKTKRELDAAYARMEDLSDSTQRFLNIACHELKAPLANAVNALRLARETDDELESRKMAGLALDGLGSLQILVSDVIHLSNISRDLEETHTASFSIRSTLESVVRIGGEPARDKGLTLDLYVDNDVPERLVGNEGWTRLICLKLVGNAVKFTRHGGITIHCRFRNGAENAIEIAVSDTGPGIPAEKLNAVFDPFQQGGPTARRHQGGLGLGLTTARDLAERMGGSITVQSVMSEGATFTVILPVALS